MTHWTGMPVVVTGAGGFIGANLTRRLAALGADVRVLVKPSTSLWRLEGLASTVRIERVDITDRAALADTIRTAAPQVIFHLAALGASRHDVDATHLFHANVVGTLNLLTAAQPLPYARFVQVGGSSEYGPRQTPLCETDRLEPVTPYGVSKAAATLAARQFARAHGRPVVILRPFSVYGPWESPTRLVPTAIRAAFEDLVLPLTPPGYRRDLVYVDDVVDACLVAATRNAEPGEIFNVGSGQQWSNEQVVDTVARISGRSIRTGVGQYRPRQSDTEHWVADTRKAERVLGWRATRTLDDGIAEVASWWGARHRRSSVLG